MLRRFFFSIVIAINAACVVDDVYKHDAIPATIEAAWMVLFVLLLTVGDFDD